MKSFPTTELFLHWITDTCLTVKVFLGWIIMTSVCDQILQNQSKSYIRQNQTNAPPVDSYTTVLLVLTVLLKLLKASFNRRLSWVVWRA